MIATHWLALSVAAGVGVLGGVAGLRPTPVTGAQIPLASTPGAIDSLQNRSYAQTLQGVQAALKVVLQNIGHAQTPGYRTVQPIFEYWDDPSGRTTGVMRPHMESNPRPGWPMDTGRALDVRIQGAGHFQVLAPHAPGGLAYTRVGHLSVDSQGFLATGMPGETAWRLAPRVAVPDAAVNFRVTAQGVVEAMAPETRRWIALGTLGLVVFPRDAGLDRVGDVLHATSAAGPLRSGEGGSAGIGSLESGSLEGSNVDLAAETEQLRHLRAWAQRLAGALEQTDPMATPLLAR